MTETAAGYLLELALDVDELEAQHGGALTIDEYLHVCRALGAMARGHQWWIGDALVYGEDHFGEEHAQAEAELALPAATATNYRYVAAHVARSRRRDDLTWSHHAEVARLEHAQQERALSIAAEQHWNVRQLRDYVALTWPQPRQTSLLPDDRPDPLGERENADVQKRVERITLALEAGDAIDRGDVAWLLDLVKRLTRGAR